MASDIKNLNVTKGAVSTPTGMPWLDNIIAIGGVIGVGGAVAALLTGRVNKWYKIDKK